MKAIARGRAPLTLSAYAAIFLLWVLALGVSIRAHAEPLQRTPYDESLLRKATGFPNTALTNGNPPIYSYLYLLSLPNPHVAAAIELRVRRPVLITGFAGVGAPSDGNMDDFNPVLNIHSSLSAFVSNPLIGDVASTLDMEWDAPVPFGTNSLGQQAYYVRFNLFQPVQLPRGDYVLSLPVGRISGTWAWSETDRRLGEDLFVSSMQPGVVLQYAGPDYRSGASALDVFGQR